MIPSDSPLRILAVDDEPTITSFIEEVLTRIPADNLPSFDFSSSRWEFPDKAATAGSPRLFQTVACRQGDEAVEAVRQSIADENPFSVAFLDVMMPPGPNGIETAERIRTIDPYIEFVLITAHSDVDPRNIDKRVRPAHKLLYLQKPFHPMEIYQFSFALCTKWVLEKQLHESHKQLENRVEQRTRELKEINDRLRHEISERLQVEISLKAREEELEKANQELEETNATLRVLLKKFQEEKTDIEDRLLVNVKERVQPLLDRLRGSRLTEHQKDHFDILETSLDDIISPFIKSLNSKYSGLTPTEIQVANLVKEGKTTKEIAEYLNSSVRAVEFHRNSLRVKLGLKYRKTNLRSFLLAIN